MRPIVKILWPLVTIRLVSNKVYLVVEVYYVVQVPGMVRSTAAEDVLLMQHHTQFLWNTYFSSVEKIVAATLEVIF